MSQTNTSDSSIIAIHHFKHTKGDTFIRQLGFYDSSHVEIDITAADFNMSVKAKDGRLILSFGIGTGFTIDSPNILSIRKEDDEMDIPAGTYTYDIERVLAGVKKTIIRGFFIIIDDDTP